MRQTCLLRLAISREQSSWGQLSGTWRRDGTMIARGNVYSSTSRKMPVFSARPGAPVAQLQEGGD